MPPPEKQDPIAKYAKVKAEAEQQGEWGSGDGGYKPPKTPKEKMRCVLLPLHVSALLLMLDIPSPGRTSRTRYATRPRPCVSHVWTLTAG